MLTELLGFKLKTPSITLFSNCNFSGMASNNFCELALKLVFNARINMNK
jgi:hypothetical protein